MTGLARVALVAARPYISAAVNTGGGDRAYRALELIDKALAEFRQEPVPAPKAQEAPWEPPGGWPPDDDEA